MLKILQQF